MVAIRAPQADAFLKSPDRGIGAVLLYGPDAGLVTERAIGLARTVASRESPPGEIVSIEDTDLEDDSGRLAVELQTVPMFGGRKIVRTRLGRRINVLLLRPLIEQGPLAGFLIVEAGALRPDESVRPVFEAASIAAAIPCYADTEQDLGRLAADVLGAAGLHIAPGVRELLVSRLGADRILSRGEIEKLALYAHGQAEVTADDVLAIVGDASDLQLDRIPEAAASGDGVRAAIDADRALAAGDAPQAIVLATQRYFFRLHRLRAAIDGGRRPEDALRGMRPPLPPKVQDVLARQTRMWTTPRLTAAMGDIAATVAATRQTGALDDLLVERLLLRLAMMTKG
jgi:DNA polymerase-3 subunit delta